jgi:hypothetical protein
MSDGPHFVADEGEALTLPLPGLDREIEAVSSK